MSVHIEDVQFHDMVMLGRDSYGNRYYSCPVCSHKTKVDKDVFYGRCSICRTTLIDYTPLPHQVDFHSSSAMFRLLMGG